MADELELDRLTSDPEFATHFDLHCSRNHDHSALQDQTTSILTLPPKLVKRVVNLFTRQLQQTWNTTATELDIIDSNNTQEIYVGRARIAPDVPEPVSKKEIDKVKALIQRLHINGGHAPFSNIHRLLVRRGCPEWMVKLVDNMTCSECAATRAPTSAPPASLRDPPKSFQVIGTDCFEITLDGVRSKYALYVDRGTKIASASLLAEVPEDQHWEPTSGVLISALLQDWLQHYPEPEWFLVDAMGAYTSKDFHEWIGANGYGLLVAPGEAHYVMGPEENLIGTIKRLVIKLSEIFPGAAVKDLVWAAVRAHNNVSNEQGYVPVQWGFGHAGLPEDRIVPGRGGEFTRSHET